MRANTNNNNKSFVRFVVAVAKVVQDIRIGDLDCNKSKSYFELAG